MRKICHITTVHTRYDVRIFHKECKSLAAHYNVSLIVADGEGDEVKDNISIIDIGKRQKSRLKRMRIDTNKAFFKAIEADCDLYHFHDPELIRTGLKLMKAGKKVIYDAHEDLPRQITGKPYIPGILKPLISMLVEIRENYAAKKFSYILTATPFICNRFLKLNSNTTDINNYPILGEMLKKNVERKSSVFCYTGGITRERGIHFLVKAMKSSQYKLLLAGPVQDISYMEEMKGYDEWENVEYFGNVDREKVGQILSESTAGFVNFLALPNHVNAQPNKIFECMSAGLPVIASDFSLWREIVEKNKCGICIDPTNSDQIFSAMKQLAENPEQVITMGENGQKVINEKYNWAAEEKKLYEIYKQILS